MVSSLNDEIELHIYQNTLCIPADGVIRDAWFMYKASYDDVAKHIFTEIELTNKRTITN